MNDDRNNYAENQSDNYTNDPNYSRLCRIDNSSDPFEPAVLICALMSRRTSPPRCDLMGNLGNHLMDGLANSLGSHLTGNLSSNPIGSISSDLTGSLPSNCRRRALGDLASHTYGLVGGFTDNFGSYVLGDILGRLASSLGSHLTGGLARGPAGSVRSHLSGNVLSRLVSNLGYILQPINCRRRGFRRGFEAWLLA
jgi:hypothetical protein